MAVFGSVLDAIGNTPLIRLRRIGSDLGAPIYAKAEFLSPGGSVKDRAALAMVDDAERSGALRPGGVIVEGTSGNTGVGLAIVAAQRGYRLVVVVPDKTSTEKVAILGAYGAEVVVTPGALPRDHKDHVSNLARRIAEETPGGWFANQYDNPANPAAHRTTTGPEIWHDTAGKLTHFVAGVGTGGTITGAAQYLKQVSGGAVTVVGADPEHSTYGGGDGSPYYVESVGHYVHPDTVEDPWPQSYDPDVVDRLVRVTDRESFHVAARLAREEGLLAGASSGTALAAALRVAAELDERHLVVVLFPDSGRSYLSKNFDPRWLRRWGFADASDEAVVGDVWPAAGDRRRPLTVHAATPIRQALHELATVDGLAEHQRVPVVLARRGDSEPAVGDVIGSTTLAELRGLVHVGDRVDAVVADHGGPAPPSVGIGEPVGTARARLAERDAAALVVSDGRVVGCISRAELDITVPSSASSAQATPHETIAAAG